MKPQRIVLAALAAAVLDAGVCLAQAPAAAKDAAPAATAIVKAQTKCPVMDAPINKSLFVDVDGKRIYVCCGGCIKTIKQDPAKYIKILEEQGVTLEKTPVPAEAVKPAAEPAKAPAATK